MMRKGGGSRWTRDFLSSFWRNYRGSSTTFPFIHRRRHSLGFSSWLMTSLSPCNTKNTTRHNSSFSIPNHFDNFSLPHKLYSNSKRQNSYTNNSDKCLKWNPPLLFSLSVLVGTKKTQAEEEEKEEAKTKAKASSLQEDDATAVDRIKDLIRLTLTCPHCEKRHFIDDRVPGVEYCSCPKALTSGVYGVSFAPSTPWTPFLERKNVLVWRQPHPTQKGNYIYKMYGKFEDVSPDEFLSVQLDLSEFRLSWDDSTAQCHVIEEDKKKNGETRQIYYWEVNWPRFFSNRDYVCHRTVRIADNKTAVVHTVGTTHPAYPPKSSTVRVGDYLSILTIVPLNSNTSENGLEFALTAYENPGVSLPESIVTWVAIRGLPEFMNNLRVACIRRRTFQHAPPALKSQDFNHSQSFSFTTSNNQHTHST